MTRRPVTLEELAASVAEVRALLLDVLRRPPVPEPLIDANELAERLNVSPSYVYEHARKLGALELPGPGSRPRLRFSWPAVLEAITSASDNQLQRRKPRPGAVPIRSPRRRRRAGPTAGPIKPTIRKEDAG